MQTQGLDGIARDYEAWRRADDEHWDRDLAFRVQQEPLGAGPFPPNMGSPFNLGTEAQLLHSVSLFGGAV